MRVTYLDHYDSFTYNLIDWLFHDTGLECDILTPENLSRFDMTTPLVLSPGPLSPEQLPETMALIRRALGKVPILGVCLGHQCLATALGGRIVRAHAPFHGSEQVVKIKKKNKLINSLSTSLKVARYNSLVVERGSIPEPWVWAFNDFEEIEGFLWEPDVGFSALAVQFHPESFLSEGVEPLKELWIRLVKDFYGRSS